MGAAARLRHSGKIFPGTEGKGTKFAVQKVMS